MRPVESHGDRHVVYVDDADAFVAELVRSGVAFRELEVVASASRTRSCADRSGTRMRLALAHARAETLQFARYPAYSLPTVVFPAVLLLLFGRQFERGEPDRLLAGFAATALLTVASSSSASASRRAARRPGRRTSGRSRRAAATRLAGRVLSALAFAAATVGRSWRCRHDRLRRRHARRGGWCALGFALLVGSVPFALLGIGFGYWLPPRAALPVANLLFLPLAVGGSLWVRPTQDVPRGVDLASQFLPTRSWIEVLDSVATGDRPLPLHHVAALAAWTAVFFGSPGSGYRRDEGERFT